MRSLLGLLMYEWVMVRCETAERLDIEFSVAADADTVSFLPLCLAALMRLILAIVVLEAPCVHN